MDAAHKKNGGPQAAKGRSTVALRVGKGREGAAQYV